MSDIAARVKKLDLGKCASVLAENEIDFQVLPQLPKRIFGAPGLPLVAWKRLLNNHPHPRQNVAN